MEDTFRHKGLRKQLMESLAEKGITNKQVLNAMLNVPRHFFMDNVFLQFAYIDKAFPIDAGQTISQPFTVAFQTSLLNIKKGDKVLEIGTGSGYQSAVLMELGAKVYTVERQKSLFTKTKPLLLKMGYKPKCYYGDGYKGIPAFAPYDSILITCGAPFVPDELVNQLKKGGVLIIPLGTGESQVMTKIVKNEDGSLTNEDLGNFSFVPMLQNKD